MSTKTWYVAVGKAKDGPFPEDLIRSRITQADPNGKILEKTPLWTKGMANWLPAGQIPEFKGAFAPAQPLPDEEPPPLSENEEGSPGLGTPPERSVADAADSPKKKERTLSNLEITRTDGLTAMISRAEQKQVRPARPSPAPKPVKKPKPEQELSALMAVNPKDLDDRTSMVDSSQLQLAKREASRVHKEMGQGALSAGNLLKIGLLLGIIGAGAYFTQSKMASKLLSPLPRLDGVLMERFEELEQVAQASVTREGPRLDIEIQKSTLSTDVQFYVVTNLPDTASLLVFVTSVAGQTLNSAPVDIRFPLTVAKRHAKTPKLHNLDGSLPADGEYLVTIVEDEIQPAVMNPILSAMSEKTDAPQFIPKGRKLFFQKKIFFGNDSGPSFQAKLKAIHQPKIETPVNGAPTPTSTPNPTAGLVQPRTPASTTLARPAPAPTPTYTPLPRITSKATPPPKKSSKKDSTKKSSGRNSAGKNKKRKSRAEGE